MFTPLSYSHDTTRDELIARFRERIALGAWVRLTKAERTELALHFVDRLALCQTEEETIALCKAEMALLEEGYPLASVANKYLPEWRKAISLAIDEGRLPPQELEPNEFGNVYRHWGLKHLLYPNQIHQALKEKTTAANNQKQDDLQPIQVERFIAKALKLLSADTPYEWAAGLLALTGRRFSEIVAKGRFQSTSHPYAIAFQGQLKKGFQNPHDSPRFLIATLVDSEQVIAALKRFRAHPRIQELADLEPDDINSRLNSSVRHSIQREFEQSGIIPVLRGEKGVTAHNLRGVYAEVAVHFFCPPNQGTHRFIQAHLGHIIGERELATRKNAGATEHYFHYRLVDEQGQPLYHKGILLERFGALPTTVEVEPEPVVVEALQESQSMATSQADAQVPLELMSQLKEIVAHKLNVDGSHAEVLETVIALLQDHTAPTLASSIESFGLTFRWFTREVERLREENRSLTLELDQARAELQVLQNQSQDHRELEGLRAENARLHAEVAQFQQIKQLLGGSSPRVDSAPATTALRDETPIAPTPARQRRPKTTSASSSTPKRFDDQEQAFAIIGQAIDLIMAWNDDPGREFQQKWLISVPILLGLIRGSGFSASQGRVLAMMKHRQSDIDHHHQKHGLGSRHNRCHGQPITEDLLL